MSGSQPGYRLRRCVDLDSRSCRESARDVGVRRRCAVGGNGDPLVRPSRLPARRRGVPGRPPGASLAGVRRGFLSVGVEDNAFTLFPEAMDSASVFLTGNCDTIYYWGFLDLRTDRWRRCPVDRSPFGDPRHHRRYVVPVGDRLRPSRPYRGQVAWYLMVGPNYDGPLPDSGFHVFHARTTRVTVIGRAVMIDNDPKLPVEAIRNGVRVSRYVPAPRHRRWHLPRWTWTVGATAAVPKARFVESSASRSTPSIRTTSVLGVGKRAVQQEPPSAADPDLLGLLASVGIVHGKPFEPDAWMRKILEEVVAVGNATARTVTFAPRPDEGFAFYSNSQWQSALRRRLPVPRSAPADHRRWPCRRPE